MKRPMTTTEVEHFLRFLGATDVEIAQERPDVKIRVWGLNSRKERHVRQVIQKHTHTYWHSSEH
jgi:hypothetical protein